MAMLGYHIAQKHDPLKHSLAGVSKGFLIQNVWYEFLDDVSR